MCQEKHKLGEHDFVSVTWSFRVKTTRDDGLVSIRPVKNAGNVELGEYVKTAADDAVSSSATDHPVTDET
jgi:hypothetical protein